MTRRPTKPPEATAETVAASTDSTVMSSADEPATTARITLPEVNPNHYERLGEFARGGLGRVIRARDRRTGRIVAIKEVLRSSDALVARFAREALVTANLQHPAIVPVYEVGCWPSGEPFYAMKLVAGQSLEDAARKASTFGERLQLLSHIAAVADALAYAHGEHVIHRDLKPANVLIGDYGETVVIDWGLAKNVAAPEDDALISTDIVPEGADGRTVLGSILGTPGFMAPEQARGEIADERGDVYAIGAMLYSILSSVTPHAEATTIDELLERVASEPPRPIREIEGRIPEELAAIVERAMAPDREARYPSAIELADELRRFQAGQLVRAYEYTPWMLLRRWIRQHRGVVLSAAIALLLLTALGVYSVQRITAERDRAESARAEAVAQTAIVELELARQYAEQGRQLVLAGEYDRAAAFLAEAVKHPEAEPSWRFLLGRALEPMEPLVALLTAHGAPVGFAHWGPDGQLLTSGNDFVAHLWDGNTGRLVRTFPGLLGTALSPDGSRLAGFGMADEISLWDARTGVRLGQAVPRRTDGSFDRPRTLEFSSDGAFFAAASMGGTVSWWTREGQPLQTVAAHHGRAFVRIRPDGKQIASGGDDGRVRVWDVASGENLWTLSAHPGGVRDLSYAPDGRLASCGQDGVARQWTEDGKLAVEFRGHKEAIAELRFSPSGEQLATASEDGSAALWDAKTGQRTAELLGHSGPVHGVSYHPSADILATRAEDGVIRLWSPTSAASRGSLIGHTAAVGVTTFSPDGSLLATAGLDYDVRVWRGIPEPSSRVLTGHDGAATAGNFSPDGALVATAGTDGTVRLWSTADGRETRVLRHGAAVSWTEFSSDGATVLSAGTDGRVLLWNADDGALLRELRGPPGPARYANFSGDGRRVVSTSPDQSVRIWRTDTGEVVHVLKTFDDSVRAARFSPDGTRVVAITDSPFAYLWNADSGELVTTIDQPAQAVYTLAFSPDGKTFAIGSDALQIGVHATADGREIHKLSGHAPGAISGVRFSPDGSTLLSVGFDGTARTWNLLRGELEQTLRDGGQPFMSGEFRADGRLIATAGLDGTARMWDSQTGRVLMARTPGGELVAARFRPDGRQLLVLSIEAAPQLWDLGDWHGSVDELRALLACKGSWRVEGASLVASRPAANACTPDPP